MQPQINIRKPVNDKQELRPLPALPGQSAQRLSGSNMITPKADLKALSS